MISELENHLWQSTLFAGVVGLLTLMLRRNRAAVRHALWLAASVKFLVPFSLLIAVGSQVEWRKAQVVQPQVSFVMGELSHPFAVPSPAPFASAPEAPSRVPAVLFCLWLCGFAANGLAWWRRWRRVRAAQRAASPLPLNLPIRVMSSPSRLEPGVFGIRKPVLLLPDGIADRLTPAQLQAILAHELCHVRRRDNLAAAVHMLVEALFWFHPLVWWIQARLVEERERACDEEVLRIVGDPQDYAEGILNVCKFYLESPLVCVSGVTGSNLKRRVEAIMVDRDTYGLNFGKKLLLTVAGILAVTAPLIVGVFNAPMIRGQSAQSPAAAAPTFEVASVRLSKGDEGPRNSLSYSPQGVTIGGCTLAFILGEAYSFPVGRLQGPGSLTKEALWAPLRQAYDIAAKADHPVPKEQLRLMLQSLLADRLKLALHFEAKSGPVYKLVVAKSGPKLEQSQQTEGFSFSAESSGYIFRNTDMTQLSAFLSGHLDRPVVDQTGLTELYNFILKRPGDAFGDPQLEKKADGTSPDSPSEGAFADGLRQLGLQLIADRAPVDYLVVDHIEMPSDN